MPSAHQKGKNAANRLPFAATGLVLGRRLGNNSGMLNKMKLVLLTAVVLLCSAASRPNAAPGSGPEYTNDGQLKLPANYREWVYLTTGFDMSYSAAMGMDHHMFDNVFVNPESFQAFLKTGTWPDK